MCTMCSEQESSEPLNPLDRRSFLRGSAAITAMTLLERLAHADALTRAQRDKLSSRRRFGADEKGQQALLFGQARRP